MEVASLGSLIIDDKDLVKAQNDFLSGSVGDEETLETIQKVWKDENYRIDPHTAVGIGAAEKLGLDQPYVSLACAHPAKFGKAIQQALGNEPDLPFELKELETLPTRCQTIEADSGIVKTYLEHVLDAG